MESKWRFDEFANVTWVHQSEGRALELAEWGVTGIVSNNVTVLNAL